MFKFLKKLILKYFNASDTQIGSLFDQAYGISTNPIYDDNGNIKFTKKGKLNNVYTLTPDGYKKIKYILETIPYNVFILTTKSGKTLEGADTHIIMTPTGQRFMKDLIKDDEILTIDGIDTVLTVVETDRIEPMYDIELEE